MMNLLARKVNGMGINWGLRLLALSLFLALLLLIAYYFLVVNRSLTPRLPTPGDTVKTIETEKRKADAALLNKIKAALSQTKRLYGYSIGVECHDGLVTLSGEVPTVIDKELAANLAIETSGVKDITNQIRITPEATPQPGAVARPNLILTVDDLEVQANVRERIISVPELKAQPIEIKVHNRAVTLTGTVASEAQKLRAEQLVQNTPKVAAVNNQLRLGNVVAPPGARLAATNRHLAQLITASLAARRRDFSDETVIQVTAQDGAITLTGTTPSRAERALVEQLTKEVAGVKSIQNLIVIATR
jgi:osmotically-inducible protein OsmY